MKLLTIAALAIATPTCFGLFFNVPRDTPKQSYYAHPSIVHQASEKKVTRKEEPYSRAPKVMIYDVPTFMGYDLKWIVPDGARQIIVRIFDNVGRKIGEYTISDYITILPGQRVELLAK